jgi:hypothetical protein
MLAPGNSFSALERGRFLAWSNPRQEDQERSRPDDPDELNRKGDAGRDSTEATTDVQVFPINDVKRSFVYACVKAKIADFRFHDLRHTAATRLADRGADAFQIAAILGHAMIQMSARYTHATGHGLRRAMESLTANGLELRETSPTISPQFGFGQSDANVETLESRRLAS